MMGAEGGVGTGAETSYRFLSSFGMIFQAIILNRLPQTPSEYTSKIGLEHAVHLQIGSVLTAKLNA